MRRLPEALRGELKTPLASVLDTAAALKAAERATLVVAVGDVVTETFLEHGRIPHVSVVDFKTKRTTEMPHLEAALKKTGARFVRVENPAAVVTDELVLALCEALARPDPTVLHIIGEEDLAVLPALEHAPDGAVVVYGQPDEGAVVVPVNAVTRARAIQLLQAMEVV